MDVSVEIKSVNGSAVRTLKWVVALLCVVAAFMAGSMYGLGSAPVIEADRPSSGTIRLSAEDCGKRYGPTCEQAPEVTGPVGEKWVQVWDFPHDNVPMPRRVCERIDPYICGGTSEIKYNPETEKVEEFVLVSIADLDNKPSTG
jgi:hypothetical protein